MNATNQESADGVIDLRLLMAHLWKRRWWITCCALVGGAMGITAAFVTVPVYRAAAVLVPASPERGSGGVLGSALGQLGGLASLAGFSVGSGDAETEEALAVLRSRQFTERFIVENNLLPKLFAKKWDASNNKWNVTPGSQPTLGKASEFFSKKIRSVTQDKKTGLVTLQIDWKDRFEAATWANELVQRLNVEMRARAILKADASINFLKNELNATSLLGSQEAINRLIEAQIKHRMLASVSQEYSFRVVDAAMAADADDPIKPNKLLLIVVGPLLGLAFGVALALMLPDKESPLS